MATQVDFAKFMVRLAIAIPRFAPNTGDAAVLHVWFAELGQLSNEELQHIYSQAIAKHDAFPSMREMLALVGKSKPDPVQVGREVAERIWEALSTYGSRRSFEDLQEFLGPIGAQVVKAAGGWHYLCDTATNAQMTTLKAQWREYATGLASHGPPAVSGPNFSQLPPRTEVAALIGGKRFDV